MHEGALGIHWCGHGPISALYERRNYPMVEWNPSRCRHLQGLSVTLTHHRVSLFDVKTTLLLSKYSKNEE